MTDAPKTSSRQPKRMSLIQLEEGMALAPKMGEPGVPMRMVATYLASSAILLKARKDEVVMESLLEQAAEMDGEEASEVMSDFLSQVTAYSSRILGSLKLPASVTAVIEKMTKGAKAATS